MRQSEDMRAEVTPGKLRRFMEELAKEAKSAGAVYFTGGATALLLGLREQTIYVDVKFDPEPSGVFEAVGRLKNILDINVELASPDDFIPVLPDWREKSVFIAEHGGVKFYHFDLRAQALSKIERDLGEDWNDARGFIEKGKISKEELWECFLGIKGDLVRYPAIEADDFERKVKNFLGKK